MKTYVCIGLLDCDYGYEGCFATSSYDKAVDWCNMMIKGYIGEFDFAQFVNCCHINVFEDDKMVEAYIVKYGKVSKSQVFNPTKCN